MFDSFTQTILEEGAKECSDVGIAVDAVRDRRGRRTGVAMFEDIVRAYWTKRYNTVIIERPDSTAVPHPTPDTQHHRQSPHPSSRSYRRKRLMACPAQGLRVLLGYLKTFRNDYRFARGQRSVIGDRTIVLNLFGCETLPPAFRLAFPRNRLILIAHTHPGDNKAARHPVRRRIERICAASANLVVFNSHENRRLWEEKLGRPVRRASVIHHGLTPPDTALPDDYPPKPECALDFVCVAQFYPCKGQTEFLDAWALALKNLGLPHVNRRGSTGVDGHRHGASVIRLIFIGDGICRAAAEARAAELNVTDSVVFMGARSNGANYFNAADVAVLMSQGAEAFGFVLLEAMSRGKPVLAARIGGIPEVVADRETGLLIDPRDTHAVAEAIVCLARDADLRSRLGSAGEQRWREGFSVERMLREYDKVLAME